MDLGIPEALLDFRATYALPVLAGLILPLIWPSGATIPQDQRSKYQVLQLCTLVGAILGAKLVVLMGDFLWPWVPLQSPWQILTSGRSLVGGYLSGFLTAEIFKPILGYKLPSNDHFARTLCVSAAIGRVGCLLSGCCQGVAYEGALAWHDAAGVGHIPSQGIELLFHLGMAGVLHVLREARIWPGRLFSFYMGSYGVFRFLSEYLRDTPKLDIGLSVYQLFCIPLVICGVTYWWRHNGPKPA